MQSGSGVLAFWREKAHGMPFEGIPLSPSYMGGEQKRKLCGATLEEKVLTCGFSAKKDGVWRDLRTKGADSSKKGSHVA